MNTPSNEQINEEVREIKPNTIYKHFKGKFYYVIDIADNATNDEESSKYVIYKALYDDNRTYIRNLEEFSSEVDREKYPCATEKYRFTEVSFERLLEILNFKIYNRGEKWVEYKNGIKILFVDESIINWYFEDGVKSSAVTNDIIMISNIIRENELGVKPKYDIMNNFI